MALSDACGRVVLVGFPIDLDSIRLVVRKSLNIAIARRPGLRVLFGDTGLRATDLS